MAGLRAYSTVGEGSPSADIDEDLGRLPAHMLIAVTDGRAQVWVDDHDYRCGPEHVLLLQAGQSVSWHLPRDCSIDTLTFDCVARPRVLRERDLTPTDTQQPTTLDQLFARLPAAIHQRRYRSTDTC